MSEAGESLASYYLTEALNGGPINTLSLPTDTSLGNFPQGRKELDTFECLVPCPWVRSLYLPVSSGALAPRPSGWVCPLNTIGSGGSTPTPGDAFRNNFPLDLISDQAYQNLQKTAPVLPVCGQDRGFLLYVPVTFGHFLSSFHHHHQNRTLGSRWEPLRGGHLGCWSLEVRAELPAPAGGQLPSPIAGSGLLQPLLLLLPPPWAMKPRAFVLNQQECDQKPTHSLITVPFSGHRLAIILTQPAGFGPTGLPTQASPLQLPPWSASCKLCSQKDLHLPFPSTFSPCPAQNIKAVTFPGASVTLT